MIATLPRAISSARQQFCASRCRAPSCATSWCAWERCRSRNGRATRLIATDHNPDRIILRAVSCTRGPFDFAGLTLAPANRILADDLRCLPTPVHCSENHRTGVVVKPYTFEKSEALMERAKKVVPGGIYGHQAPLVLTKGAFPSFFARGEGSHIWDVDGNEYIDYMCSYGPIVLGHRHPKVEEAARRQMDLGNCFNAPGPVWVELAEHLVSITPFADWTVFAKNGSDVCTWATEVARHATGRPKIAMCSGAYHGTHAWCTPAPAGVMPEDRASIVYFRFNDLDSLRRTVEENSGKIAGVIISPFKHDAGHDSELPVEGFFAV